MNPDLKKIKKLYGEKMMHLCRTLFPTILEESGKLVELLTDSFNPNPTLYDDIVDNGVEYTFQSYITNLNKKDEEIVDEEVEETTKSVRELLSEAGYDFFECNTEEEIQSFRKYYKEEEELCTFSNNRLNNCHVFWAVKKNVDEIKREDFKNPKRQDQYGTSVISIQFAKNSNNTLSIKNRYNHTVNNPDATFSNNLDNIIPGLANAFEKEFGFNINKNGSSNFELPNYVQVDKKFYKYNYEIDNIYYCPNNIIIDNFEAKKYDKEKYIIMDYFTLDLVNKKMTINENSPSIKEDSFIDEFNDIDKVDVVNTEDGNKEVRITTKTNHEIVIGLDKCNRIISYHNPRVTKIKDDFLRYNETLKSISLQSLEEVGNNFIYRNECIEEVSFPKLKKAGNNFLIYNELLKSISLLSLEEVGDNFILFNENIEEIEVPKLKKIGKSFMWFNKVIKEIYVPDLCAFERKKLSDKFIIVGESKNIDEIDDKESQQEELFDIPIVGVEKASQVLTTKINEAINEVGNYSFSHGIDDKEIGVTKK